MNTKTVELKWLTNLVEIGGLNRTKMSFLNSVLRTDCNRLAISFLLG